MLISATLFHVVAKMVGCSDEIADIPPEKHIHIDII
jgi:hypothetical protein